MNQFLLQLTAQTTWPFTITLDCEVTGDAKKYAGKRRTLRDHVEVSLLLNLAKFPPADSQKILSRLSRNASTTIEISESQAIALGVVEWLGK